MGYQGDLGTSPQWQRQCHTSIHKSTYVNSHGDRGVKTYPLVVDEVMKIVEVLTSTWYISTIMHYIHSGGSNAKLSCRLCIGDMKGSS